MKLLSRFWADDSGTSAVEYAFIVALIALAIIGGLSAVGTAVNQKFSTAATSLN